MTMKRDRVSFDYDLRFVLVDKIQIECWYWCAARSAFPAAAICGDCIKVWTSSPEKN